MPAIDLSRYQPQPKQVFSHFEDKGFADFMTREISFGRKELSDKKKENLYLELSSLLQAGIDLKSSFDLLAAGLQKTNSHNLIKQIENLVISGHSFSDAVNLTGKFSLYEVYSIKIGEESGKIIEVLQDLAKYYQNKIKQRRKIIGAVTYPLIVMATSLGAVFFMLKFVVPMFGDVFKRFGGELPWITAQIIKVSEWMQQGFVSFFLILSLCSIALFLGRKTETSRRVMSALILRTPIAGPLVQKIYLARFCNSMRLLINAHLPLLQAISLVQKMISFYPIESSLNVIENDILKGKTLHQSLQQFKIYPAKMIMLIKVGEETNQLDYFFGKISSQYIDEIEYKASTISSLMEPLIIIFLGLLVGIILVAMYLPLFQMSNSF